MSFKAFLTSKTFLIQLAVAIGLTLFILLAVTWGIRIYTNHGESFNLPDLKGMSVYDAENVLQSKNLEYEIADSTYLDSAVPGSVIGQVPDAGHAVKEGRTIFLSICAIAPEQVKMPQLTDISFRQAVNLMQTAGLNVGRIDYVPSEFPNLVLEQKIDGLNITSGTLVNKGSRVDLLIGKSRTGEKTVIPNLFGETLSQARGEIASLYLNLGAVIYDESVQSREDSLSAKVWQQRPSHDSYEEIELGASIDVWLTINTEKLMKETDSVLEIDSIGGM